MGRKMGAVVDDQMNGVANDAITALHGSGIPPDPPGTQSLPHQRGSGHDPGNNTCARGIKKMREGKALTLPIARFRQLAEFCSA